MKTLFMQYFSNQCHYIALPDVQTTVTTVP